MATQSRLFSVYWGTSSLKGDGIMNLMATSHDEARKLFEQHLAEQPGRYPSDISEWMVSDKPVEPWGCVVCSARLARIGDDQFAGDKYRCTNRECARPLWFEKLGSVNLTGGQKHFLRDLVRSGDLVVYREGAPKTPRLWHQNDVHYYQSLNHKSITLLIEAGYLEPRAAVVQNWPTYQISEAGREVVKAWEHGDDNR